MKDNGEPTAHPNLSEVVAGLRGIGLDVKATSIGCSEDTLRKLAVNGLQGINFSVHALDPLLLHSTQIDRTLKWTERQMQQQIQAIMLAKELGLNVKINSVLAKVEDIPRVRDVLHWAEATGIPLRIMNELSSGEVSYQAIEQRAYVKLGGYQKSATNYTNFTNFLFFRVNSCNSWQILCFDPAKSCRATSFYS